jgi:hypothetical protein
MSRLSDYIRRWQARPKVRPWALAGPVVVLLICLPLLRPLRHPTELTRDEAARFQTVRALVEHHTLALPPDNVSIAPIHTIVVNQKAYSDQPPVFAVLLAGAYWIMLRCGNSFHENPVLVPYLLTLIGVTIPVAGAAGLVYRMGRLFELPRIWRASLGLAVVLGSGLVSYGVVLNAYAPAAVLLLAAMACAVHVGASKKPARAGGWLALAGFCAATAVTLDPAAILPALLIGFASLAIRMKPILRAAGFILFMLGALPPIALHAALILPISGSVIPRSFMRELGRPNPGPVDQGFEDDLQDSRAALVGKYVGRLYTALIGSHGLLSHFPVMLLGLAGVGAVMHRNWLASTKALAAASALALGGIVGLYCFSNAEWRDAMFAARWFIVFSPMVLYWIGAWARHAHTKTDWCIAAALLGFSAIVGLIGATGPCPPGGFDRYTVAGAIKNLLRGDAAPRPPALAAKQ